MSAEEIVGYIDGLNGISARRRHNRNYMFGHRTGIAERIRSIRRKKWVSN